MRKVGIILPAYLLEVPVSLGCWWVASRVWDSMPGEDGSFMLSSPQPRCRTNSRSGKVFTVDLMKWMRVILTKSMARTGSW